MLEFPRSYCLYHPTEVITNFCRQRACLLPLCPSCVCSHLDFHVKRGGQLKFDNIHETYHLANKIINEYSDKLDEERRKANSLQNSVDRLYSKVSDIIFQAKLEVRELIDKKFQELEKDTMATLAKQCDSSGLHSKQKIVQLEQRIVDGQKQVTNILRDLRSDRSLATLILFNGEKRVEFQKLLNDIDREFQLNYEFDPRITINTEAFDIFSKGVNQLLDIKFNLPQQLKAKQVIERPTMVRNLSKDSLLDRAPLTSVINKRATPTPQQLAYFNNNQNKQLMLSRLRCPSTTGPFYSPSAIVKPTPTVVHHHHYSVFVPPQQPLKSSQQCENLPQDSVLTDNHTASYFRKTDRPVSKSKKGLTLHERSDSMSKK